MRLSFFLLAFSLILGSRSSAQQHSMAQASAHYFRVNPLDRPFSMFLEQVMADSSFKLTEKRLRTDTALFYLRGNYQNFNPFRFTPATVQLVLFEQEVTYDSVSNLKDTIFVCMITAVPRSVEKAAEKETHSEFEWSNRRFGKDFIDHETTLLEEGGVTAGEITDHYIGSPVVIPPLSFFWGKLLGDKTEDGFGVVLRLKVISNNADLPVPPDRS